MEIKLEKEQQNWLLYYLKTFENYNVTVFVDITEYCNFKLSIEKGFITFNDYVILSKINILLDVENEYMMWREFAEAALKFKKFFHEIEEKFMGGGEKVD